MEPILSNENAKNDARSCARFTFGKIGGRSSLRRADPCMVRWAVRKSLLRERVFFDAARPVESAARRLRHVVRETSGHRYDCDLIHGLAGRRSACLVV